MSEEVGAGFGGQLSHELFDAAAKCLFGALGALAQECLEGAGDSSIGLRSVEDGGRIAQGRAGPLPDIVHHHDVAAFECRHQALIDIGQKVLPVAPLRPSPIFLANAERNFA